MQIYVHIHICIYICICTHADIYLHNSCMRACATVQQLPCHGSYCELILSLARTSCRLSFPPALLPLRRAGRPPAGPLTDLFAKKSVQSAFASSMVHTRAWPRISLDKNLFSLPFSRVFVLQYVYHLLMWATNAQCHSTHCLVAAPYSTPSCCQQAAWLQLWKLLRGNKHGLYPISPKSDPVAGSLN